MWETVKNMLDSTHLAAVLAGMLVAAGVAWGTGAQKLEQHEHRISVVEGLLEKKIADAEQARRTELRDFREEVARRLDRIEDRINRSASK